jgi:hypothetical protein
MKRLALAAAFLLIVSIALAHSDGIYNPTANNVGNFEGIDSNKASGAVAFTGPGDIQTSGVVAWYGLRAYSAAKRGSAVANVCNSTGGVDVGCADMLSNASTGALVPQTISGIPCPGANCTVKIIYDQSGANSCTVNSVANSPCNIGTVTVASRPTLTTTTLSFSGAQAPSCGVINSGNCTITTSSAQPYVISAVVERTGAFTVSGAYFGDAGNFSIGFNSTANTLNDYCGTNQTLAGVNDNAYHAIQTQCNGASGIIYVDGTSNTLNMGALALSTGSNGFRIGDDAFSNFLTGNVEEVGIWLGDQSSHFSTLNTNQHTFWGF